MDRLSILISHLPHKQILFGRMSIVMILLIFVTILLWLQASEKKYFRISVIMSLLILNILIWKSMLWSDPVTFWILDVGQGDACVIEDGENSIIIDAGYAGFGRDNGKNIILPFLKKRGIRKLDLAVFSHPHSDHIGGFYTIFKEIEIKAVWDTRNCYKSSLYQAIQVRCDTDSIPVMFPQPGEIYGLGRLRMTILYPGDQIAGNVSNINNASLVIRIDIGNDSFLMTGDMEEEGENYLYNMDEIHDIDVIKLGHHGSITSSTDKFCQFVHARYGVISVGQKNKYGHPSTEIIRRWQSRNTRILRTDKDGAVRFETRGKGVRVSTMK